MHAIAVPFCYLPSTLFQTFDLATCKRSVFQVKELQRISQLPEFAFFVILKTGDDVGYRGDVIIHPDYPQAVHVMWYDKTGAMHSTRIGRKRILSNAALPLHGKPSALDSSVYTSRCY